MSVPLAVLVNLALANDLERAALVLAEPEHGEVVVERRDTVNAESEHDGEAGSVGNGKILIGKLQPHGPRGLQVRRVDGLDGGNSTPKAFPEFLGRSAVESKSQKDPRFDQNVVGG